MPRVTAKLNSKSICQFKSSDNNYTLAKIPELLKNNIKRNMRDKVVPFIRSNDGTITEIVFVTDRYKRNHKSLLRSEYCPYRSFFGPLCPVTREE